MTGDDETITVDLARVHRQIDTIFLLVTSYQGHTLEWVANAYCRVVDEQGVELARITLTLGVPETGVVMARISRDGDGWRLRAVAEGIAVKLPTESGAEAEALPLSRRAAAVGRARRSAAAAAIRASDPDDVGRDHEPGREVAGAGPVALAGGRARHRTRWPLSGFAPGTCASRP